MFRFLLRSVAGLIAWAALLPLAAQDTPVRFVAYNLKNYLPMDRSVGGQSVSGAPKPEAEIAAILATLVDLKPDLLGVCEIGGEAEVADLKSRLKAVGIDLPHHEWVDAADADRHLALLSRFPIVARNSARDLVYRLGEAELPFQRGILDATVEFPSGYRLRCLGLHFKSKREVPEGDQAMMRRHEADLLRRHADTILAADPQTNLLVYGDLNDTRNEPAIRAVQGSNNSPGHLSTIYLKDRFGMSWTHHWDFANLYSRIDYILFNEALRPEIVFDQCLVHWRDDWEEGSDHRALLAVISPADRPGKQAGR